MSRIIQVPIDDTLLRDLDALSGERGQPRAAVIREACQQYIADERRRRLEDAYEAGYRRTPESPMVGETQVALLTQVLDPEDW